MTLKNCVVFVTGSAERVGKSIALTLAAKGANVVIQYRSKPEKAEETVSEAKALGSDAIMTFGDISREADWLRMRDEIIKHYGRIDVLVNNAAIIYKTPFLSSTEEQWDNFMNVNLKSVYLGSRIFGEIMVKQQSGKIINIADISGETIWPSYIPYCVSKSGVLALTRGLAKTLAPHVSVNAVSPGTVLEGIEDDPASLKKLTDGTPLKRIGQPEDIANAVLFLIEGSDFITGINIKVDGGRSIA